MQSSFIMLRNGDVLWKWATPGTLGNQLIVVVKSSGCGYVVIIMLQYTQRLLECIIVKRGVVQTWCHVLDHTKPQYKQVAL